MIRPATDTAERQITAHWRFKGETTTTTVTYVIPARRSWLLGVSPQERSLLAMAVRKARRGEFATPPDPCLLDINTAILAAVRMRGLPHLRRLVKAVAEEREG